MARDLEPLLAGATITDVWWDWDKAIRHPKPEEFRARLIGSRVLGVGRRAKWLVVALSGGDILAIQV